MDESLLVALAMEDQCENGPLIPIGSCPEQHFREKPQPFGTINGYETESVHNDIDEEGERTHERRSDEPLEPCA
jgi:hypothetical protein